MQAAVTTQAAALARLILSERDEPTRRAMLALTLGQLLGVSDADDAVIQDAADSIRAGLIREAELLLEECRDERLIEWTLNTSEGMRLAESWWREAYVSGALKLVRARVQRGMAA
jgi:hypothetical protein